MKLLGMTPEAGKVDFLLVSLLARGGAGREWHQDETGGVK